MVSWVMQESQVSSEEPRNVETARCDRCGRFGAYQFEGATLCEDCYQGCGSCCPEFGSDDLWPKDEKG